VNIIFKGATPQMKIMAAAAGGAAIAALLPWVSILWITIYGIQTDWGKISLVAAIVGFGALFVARLPWWVHTVPAVIVTGCGGYVFVRASNIASMGVYLTLFCGVVWFVAALKARKVVAVVLSEAPAH
jgi:hypothetical protein